MTLPQDSPPQAAPSPTTRSRRSVAARAGVVAHAELVDAGSHTVVLVEGRSDKFALEALAHRRDRDLESEGVAVVAMGGATNIGHYLDLFGPRGADLKLAGLCDAGEEGYFQRHLDAVGLASGSASDRGSGLTRADLERIGFFVCELDLEDELIRALGTTTVDEVIDAQGELRLFRTFQRQPAQKGRSHAAQLRRFMGTRSGRKLHYASQLVGALEPDRAPRPLEELLAHV